MKRQNFQIQVSGKQQIEYVELCQAIRKKLKEEKRNFNIKQIKEVLDKNKSLKKLKQL